MSYCYDNQTNKCMAWVKRVYCKHLPYIGQLGLEFMRSWKFNAQILEVSSKIGGKVIFLFSFFFLAWLPIGLAIEMELNVGTLFDDCRTYRLTKNNGGQNFAEVALNSFSYFKFYENFWMIVFWIKAKLFRQDKLKMLDLTADYSMAKAALPTAAAAPSFFPEDLAKG